MEADRASGEPAPLDADQAGAPASERALRAARVGAAGPLSPPPPWTAPELGTATPPSQLRSPQRSGGAREPPAGPAGHTRWEPAGTAVSSVEFWSQLEAALRTDGGGWGASQAVFDVLRSTPPASFAEHLRLGRPQLVADVAAVAVSLVASLDLGKPPDAADSPTLAEQETVLINALLAASRDGIPPLRTVLHQLRIPASEQPRWPSLDRLLALLHHYHAVLHPSQGDAPSPRPAVLDAELYFTLLLRLVAPPYHLVHIVDNHLPLLRVHDDDELQLGFVGVLRRTARILSSSGAGAGSARVQQATKDDLAAALGRLLALAIKGLIADRTVERLLEELFMALPALADRVHAMVHGLLPFAYEAALQRAAHEATEREAAPDGGRHFQASLASVRGLLWSAMELANAAASAASAKGSTGSSGTRPPPGRRRGPPGRPADAATIEVTAAAEDDPAAIEAASDWGGDPVRDTAAGLSAGGGLDALQRRAVAAGSTAATLVSPGFAVAAGLLYALPDAASDLEQLARLADHFGLPAQLSRYGDTVRYVQDDIGHMALQVTQLFRGMLPAALADPDPHVGDAARFLFHVDRLLGPEERGAKEPSALPVLQWLQLLAGAPHFLYPLTAMTRIACVTALSPQAAPVLRRYPLDRVLPALAHQLGLRVRFSELTELQPAVLFQLLDAVESRDPWVRELWGCALAGLGQSVRSANAVGLQRLSELFFALAAEASRGRGRPPAAAAQFELAAALLVGAEAYRTPPRPASSVFPAEVVAGLFCALPGLATLDGTGESVAALRANPSWRDWRAAVWQLHAALVNENVTAFDLQYLSLNRRDQLFAAMVPAAAALAGLPDARLDDVGTPVDGAEIKVDTIVLRISSSRADVEQLAAKVQTWRMYLRWLAHLQLFPRLQAFFADLSQTRTDAATTSLAVLRQQHDRILAATAGLPDALYPLLQHFCPPDLALASGSLFDALCRIVATVPDAQDGAAVAAMLQRAHEALQNLVTGRLPWREWARLRSALPKIHLANEVARAVAFGPPVAASAGAPDFFVHVLEHASRVLQLVTAVPDIVAAVKILAAKSPPLLPPGAADAHGIFGVLLQSQAVADAAAAAEAVAAIGDVVKALEPLERALDSVSDPAHLQLLAVPAAFPDVYDLVYSLQSKQAAGGSFEVLRMQLTTHVQYDSHQSAILNALVVVHSALQPLVVAQPSVEALVAAVGARPLGKELRADLVNLQTNLDLVASWLSGRALDTAENALHRMTRLEDRGVARFHLRRQAGADSTFDIWIPATAPGDRDAVTTSATGQLLDPDQFTGHERHLLFATRDLAVAAPAASADGAAAAPSRDIVQAHLEKIQLVRQVFAALAALEDSGHPEFQARTLAQQHGALALANRPADLAAARDGHLQRLAQWRSDLAVYLQPERASPLLLLSPAEVAILTTILRPSPPAADGTARPPTEGDRGLRPSISGARLARVLLAEPSQSSGRIASDATPEPAVDVSPAALGYLLHMYVRLAASVAAEYSTTATVAMPDAAALAAWTDRVAWYTTPSDALSAVHGFLCDGAGLDPDDPADRWSRSVNDGRGGHASLQQLGGRVQRVAVLPDRRDASTVYLVLLELYGGRLPASPLVLHGDDDGISEADLTLFFLRVRAFPGHSFVVVAVDRMPAHLQRKLLDGSRALAHAIGGHGDVTYLVEASNALFTAGNNATHWLTLDRSVAERAHTATVADLRAAHAAQLAGRLRIVAVTGPEGHGKSHYIRTHVFPAASSAHGVLQVALNDRVEHRRIQHQLWPLATVGAPLDTDHLRMAFPATFRRGAFATAESTSPLWQATPAAANAFAPLPAGAQPVLPPGESSASLVVYVNASYQAAAEAVNRVLFEVLVCGAQRDRRSGLVAVYPSAEELRALKPSQLVLVAVEWPASGGAGAGAGASRFLSVLAQQSVEIDAAHYPLALKPADQLAATLLRVAYKGRGPLTARSYEGLQPLTLTLDQPAVCRESLAQLAYEVHHSLQGPTVAAAEAARARRAHQSRLRLLAYVRFVHSRALFFEQSLLYRHYNVHKDVKRKNLPLFMALYLLREAAALAAEGFHADLACGLPGLILLHHERQGGLTASMLVLDRAAVDRADEEIFGRLVSVIPRQFTPRHAEPDDWLEPLALGLGFDTQVEMVRDVLRRQQFVLVPDYALRLLFIHDRKRTRLPLIIESETGVGKTFLLETYAELLNAHLLQDKRTELAPHVATAFREYLLTEFNRYEDKLESHHKLIHGTELRDKTRSPKLDQPRRPVDAALTAYVQVKLRKFVVDLLATSAMTPAAKNSLLVRLCEQPQRMYDQMRMMARSPELQRRIERLPRTSDAVANRSEPERAALVDEVFSIVCDMAYEPVRPFFFRLLIHPGVTEAEIIRFMAPALSVATQVPGCEVLCFFDEVNTSSVLSVFHEMLIDRTLAGEPVPGNIFFVAAINPFMGDAPSGLELADASASATDDDNGGAMVGVQADGQPSTFSVPYNVHDLPAGLKELRWWFAPLQDDAIRMYIRRRIEMMPVGELGLDLDRQRQLSEAVVVCQHYFLHQIGRGSVSQRDIQRVFRILPFLHRIELQSAAAAAVAVALVYYLRLPLQPPRPRGRGSAGPEAAPAPCTREHLAAELRRTVGLDFGPIVDDAIQQTVSAEHFLVPDGVALNQALRENVFATVVAVHTRVPLAIVGPPGSSKTLSFQMVLQNLKGAMSATAFCKRLDPVDPYFCQCSKDSTPEDISSILDMAKSRQARYDESGETRRCVVFMDEASLPSRKRMVLKVLHPYLDECAVAFVSISNAPFDPANANRMMQLLRSLPSSEDMRLLALSCLGLRPRPDSDAFADGLCDGFRELLGHPDFAQWFHYRDFVYMLRQLRRESESVEETFSPTHLLRALERNFNGLPRRRFVELVNIVFAAVARATGLAFAPPPPSAFRSILSLLQEALAVATPGPGTGAAAGENALRDRARYKLVIDPTGDDSGARLLFELGLLDPASTLVIHLSDFDNDANDMYRVEQLSRIKHAMEHGQRLLLVRTGSLHGSLYDVFNQNFTSVVGADAQIFSKIAIGSRTKDCVVAPAFECIVHLRQSELADMPAPFLSRFEKYELDLEEFLAQQLHQLEPPAQLAVRDARARVEALIARAGSVYFYGWSGAMSMVSLLLAHIKQAVPARNALPEDDAMAVVDEAPAPPAAPSGVSLTLLTDLTVAHGELILSRPAAAALATDGRGGAGLALPYAPGGGAASVAVSSEHARLASTADLVAPDARSLVRALVARLFQTVPAEAGLVRVLPAIGEAADVYRELYFGTHIHFSLAEIVRRLIALSLSRRAPARSPRASGDAVIPVDKLVVFMRTSAATTHLAQTVARWPLDVRSAVTVLDINVAVTTQALLSDQLALLAGAPQCRVVLMTLSGTGSGAVGRISFVRQLVDDAVAQAAATHGHTAAFVLVVTLAPELLYVKACYPSIYLRGWDFCFCDSSTAVGDMHLRQFASTMATPASEPSSEHELPNGPETGPVAGPTAEDRMDVDAGNVNAGQAGVPWSVLTDALLEYCKRLTLVQVSALPERGRGRGCLDERAYAFYDPSTQLDVREATLESIVRRVPAVQARLLGVFQRVFAPERLSELVRTSALSILEGRTLSGLGDDVYYQLSGQVQEFVIRTLHELCADYGLLAILVRLDHGELDVVEASLPLLEKSVSSRHLAAADKPGHHQVSYPLSITSGSPCRIPLFRLVHGRIQRLLSAIRGRGRPEEHSDELGPAHAALTEAIEADPQLGPLFALVRTDSAYVLDYAIELVAPMANAHLGRSAWERGSVSAARTATTVAGLWLAAGPAAPATLPGTAVGRIAYMYTTLEGNPAELHTLLSVGRLLANSDKDSLAELADWLAQREGDIRRGLFRRTEAEAPFLERALLSLWQRLHRLIEDGLAPATPSVANASAAAAAKRARFGLETVAAWLDDVSFFGHRFGSHGVLSPRLRRLSQTMAAVAAALRLDTEVVRAGAAGVADCIRRIVTETDADVDGADGQGTSRLFYAMPSSDATVAPARPVDESARVEDVLALPSLIDHLRVLIVPGDVASRDHILLELLQWFLRDCSTNAVLHAVNVDAALDLLGECTTAPLALRRSLLAALVVHYRRRIVAGTAPAVARETAGYTFGRPALVPARTPQRSAEDALLQRIVERVGGAAVAMAPATSLREAIYCASVFSDAATVRAAQPACLTHPLVDLFFWYASASWASGERGATAAPPTAAAAATAPVATTAALVATTAATSSVPSLAAAFVEARDAYSAIKITPATSPLGDRVTKAVWQYVWLGRLSDLLCALQHVAPAAWELELPRGAAPAVQQCRLELLSDPTGSVLRMHWLAMMSVKVGFARTYQILTLPAVRRCFGGDNWLDGFAIELASPDNAGWYGCPSFMLGPALPGRPTEGAAAREIMFAHLYLPFVDVSAAMTDGVQTGSWLPLAACVQRMLKPAPHGGENIPPAQVHMLLIVAVYYNHFRTERQLSLVRPALAQLKQIKELALHGPPLVVLTALLYPEQSLAAVPHNHVSQLFSLAGEAGGGPPPPRLPADVNYRNFLVNLMATVVGTGDAGHHLWTLLFSPMQVNSSFGFGSSMSSPVTHQIHYDCGCVIELNGRILNQEENVLKPPAAYLAYMHCFGALAMSMLLPSSAESLPVAAPSPECQLIGAVLTPHHVMNTRGHPLESPRSKAIHFCFERVSRGWQCLEGQRPHLLPLLLARSLERYAWLAGCGPAPATGRPFRGRYGDGASCRAAEAAFTSSVYLHTWNLANQYEIDEEQSHSSLRLQSLLLALRDRFLATDSTWDDFKNAIAQYSDAAVPPASAADHRLDVSVLDRFVSLRSRLHLMCELPAILALYEWAHETLSGRIAEADKDRPLAYFLEGAPADARAIAEAGVAAFNRVHDEMQGFLHVGACQAEEDFHRIDVAATPLYYMLSEPDPTLNDAVFQVLGALVRLANDFLDGCVRSKDGGPRPADSVARLLLTATVRPFTASASEACSPESRRLLLCADAPPCERDLEAIMRMCRLDSPATAPPRFDLVRMQRIVIADYIAGRCRLHLHGVRRVFRYSHAADALAADTASAAPTSAGAVPAVAASPMDVDDVSRDPAAPAAGDASAVERALATIADPETRAAVAMALPRLGALHQDQLREAVAACGAARRRLETLTPDALVAVRGQLLADYLAHNCKRDDVAWCPSDFTVAALPAAQLELDRCLRRWTHLSRQTSPTLQHAMPAAVEAAVQAHMAAWAKQPRTTALAGVDATLAAMQDLAVSAESFAQLPPTEDHSLAAFFALFVDTAEAAPVAVGLPATLEDRHYVAFQTLLLEWRRRQIVEVTDGDRGEPSRDASASAPLLVSSGAALVSNSAPLWHEL